jgi:hypothetical protein
MVLGNLVDKPAIRFPTVVYHVIGLPISFSSSLFIEGQALSDLR